MKKYPVKNFLLTRSRLVKFNQKQAAGQDLTKQQLAQERRIYELRDETFRRLVKEIARYYEVATGGNYRYDGMSEIERGISGWIEVKIWRLLVVIGEPDHARYQDIAADYWEEEK